MLLLVTRLLIAVTPQGVLMVDIPINDEADFRAKFGKGLPVIANTLLKGENVYFFCKMGQASAC